MLTWRMVSPYREQLDVAHWCGFCLLSHRYFILWFAMRLAATISLLQGIFPSGLVRCLDLVCMYEM